LRVEKIEATADAMPTPQGMPDVAWIAWTEAELPQRARWRSERAAPPPARVVLADDTLSADAAYRLACEGTALLWRGDFHNARQLLLAMARRVDRPRRQAHAQAAPAVMDDMPGAAFHRHRQAQSQRARVLGQLLIGLEADHTIPLRRAPDHRLACSQAWGHCNGDGEGGPSVVSLRELLGVVSAFEWRKKGVAIAALGPAPDNRIHPHHGVFSPVRGEYIDLVAHTPLPPGAQALALDIGTSTGVLAAVLARRGVQRVRATDCDPRALACARDNLSRLGLTERVQLVAANLFPPPPDERAALVVCNPPWLPARAGSPIERAVYDEGSAMLRGYLSALSAHLLPGGEGWLILSDLAEHLGLRRREDLLGWIEAAGLRVLGRVDTRPKHPKASDALDPLHAARAAEVTSLWRLGVLAA
jgi:SAM-dependent methyltransferase